MTLRKDQRPMVQLPKHFTPNFMEVLDGRTVLARAARERYEEVIADQGGEENLSRIRRSLVRRLIWQEILIEAVEADVAAGVAADMDALTKLTNSYVRLARTLGLNRHARRVPRLRDIMAGDTVNDAVP